MEAAILERIELPDIGGALTLYGWMADDVRDGRNLVRTSVDGTVLWRAKPPLFGSQDCFTAINWDGQTLTAYSWSCYRVAVNMQDGDITVLEFTK